MRTLSRFAIDERGATSIEYALIAGYSGHCPRSGPGQPVIDVAGLYTKVQDYFNLV